MTCQHVRYWSVGLRLGESTGVLGAKAEKELNLLKFIYKISD